MSEVLQNEIKWLRGEALKDDKKIRNARAEIERLRAALAAQTWCPDCGKVLEIPNPAFEEAAKIKPVEPAWMRRGDPTWEVGWHRGVQDFRAAIRAKAKGSEVPGE